MRKTILAGLMEDARVTFINDRTVYKKVFVSSISTDTRSLKEGDLFVALAGERYEGHSFIDNALKGGAAGIVFETGRIDSVKRYFANYPEVFFIGVPDTRKVLGKIAKNYLNNFSLKKSVVTGSAGKTTTKQLIKAVLSQRYNVVSSAQSYNNDIGVPKTIFNIDKDTDMLVQELGTNHPGEIAYLSDIVRQDFALITNIGPAHIGFFNSEESIAREKKSALEPLGPDGVAFLNAEDKFFQFLKKDLSAQVKSFGLKKGDLHPEKVIKIGLDSSEFVMAGEKIRSRVTGRHGITNAAASAIIGIYFGLTIREIKKGIESYTGEKGRGSIFKLNGATVIDESYNANPLSVSASIQFISNVTVQGKKILILGDMLELGDKSEYYHRYIAEDIIRGGIKSLYTYGQMARVTAEACKDKGHPGVLYFNDIKELVCCLKKEVRRGDLVLVKGSRAMKLERVIQGMAEPSAFQ